NPARTAVGCDSRQTIPIFLQDVGLIENAPQRAHRDLGLSRHNRRIDSIIDPANEFDVATLLAGFDEACRLETSFHLAEGLRLKPPQPLPQSCEPSVDALLAAAQSIAPAPP